MDVLAARQDRREVGLPHHGRGVWGYRVNGNHVELRCRRLLGRERGRQEKSCEPDSCSFRNRHWNGPFRGQYTPDCNWAAIDCRLLTLIRTLCAVELSATAQGDRK